MLSVLVLGAALFCLGLAGLLAGRTATARLLASRFMPLGAIVTAVGFARMHGSLSGHVFAIFVLVVAAAETAIALLHGVGPGHGQADAAADAPPATQLNRAGHAGEISRATAWPVPTVVAASGGLALIVFSADLIILFLGVALAGLPVAAFGVGRSSQAGSTDHARRRLGVTLSIGLLQMGLACIYGLTGRTDIPPPGEFALAGLASPVGIVGLGLSLAGLLIFVAVLGYEGMARSRHAGETGERLAAIVPMLAGIGAIGRVLAMACGY